MRSRRLIDDNNTTLLNIKLAVLLTDVDPYVETLVDFYFIMRTLEKEMREHSMHPCVLGLLPEELLRTEAFERDLVYYIGDDWRETVRPSKEAEAYCNRIVKAATTDPTLLLA